MRPTFLGFETQKRTLQLAQKNIDITGNNVSNINTPGYTRQRVDLYAESLSGNRDLRWNSKTTRLAMAGQGVAAYGVGQIRDIYIDKRYRQNVAVEAETAKMVDILSDIEDVLDNFETDGLQYFTQEFFNSLQDYANEKPDSAEVATICVNTAVNLCQLLNDYHTRLKEVENTYVSELSDTLEYVNNLLEKMNVLNDKIVKEKFHYPEEYGPNELYDEMNLMIDELATFGNIEVTQHKSGAFSVKMGGVTVLNGEEMKTNRILMEPYENYGEAILFFESGHPFNITSGEIKGYYDMINGNGVYAAGHQNGYYGIPYFQSAVNEFARTIAKTFNDANYGNVDEFRNMFEPAVEGAVITAGNIRVSQSWKQDPTMIGKARRLDEQTGLYFYGYDEQAGEVINVDRLDLDSINNNGATSYSFAVQINGVTKNIQFTSGTTKSASVANLKAAVSKEFPNTVFTLSSSGDMAGVILIDGDPVKVSSVAVGTSTALGVESKPMVRGDNDKKLVSLQNSNVLYLISQFDNKDIKFGNYSDFSGSIYEYISFISNRLGQTIQYEDSRNETAEMTVDTLLDARDNVSAVDFDEEGINMLNYQKWYNASSRIVTALDDLLDKLINGTGRVGL
ncbi:MAG: flagellar basal body protein [Oscillospiraceae bacterium]|nr:flagellar basal body protein [Oscillospiraceae bacterium]